MSTLYGKDKNHGVKDIRITVKALLLMVEKGHVPDIREIKVAFGVSRATAYRYKAVLAVVYDEVMDAVDKLVEAELVEMVHDKHIRAERQRKAQKQVSIRFEDTPQGQGLAS